MFRIEAKNRILYLPNPRFSDGWNNNSSVILKRIMDGSVRTLVRKLEKIDVHNFDFELTNEKARETLDFFGTYIGDVLTVVGDQHSVKGYVNIPSKQITSLQRSHSTTTNREKFSFAFSIMGDIQNQVSTLAGHAITTPQLHVWVEE